MFAKIKNFLFLNTSTKQTVAKNTVWLTISNFGGRLLRAIVVIYGARVLGAAGYGVYSYALTLAGFFTLFVDPGLNAAIMRDASKSDEARRLEIFSTASIAKLVLLAFGVLIVLFVAPYFSTLPGAIALLPIVAFIIAFDNLRDFMFTFIRVREKMEWEAGIFLLLNLAIVVFGLVALAFHPTPVAFGWSYVAGTGLGFLVTLWTFRDYLRQSVSHFSAQLIKPLFASAWPFAITGALGILLTNTDILIISWMRSATEVGIYAAAIRIVQVLYLVPTIVQLSILPLLSRLAKNDDQKFRAVLERVIGTIFLASVPLAVGGAILATPIMKFVFGTSYGPGGLAFGILMITMLVDFPAAIIANAIFAYNHQRSLIITSLIGGVANVVLDLILIPPFGMAGSAVATLFAQFLSNWYLWHTMKKINYFEVVPRLGRIAAAGILMGAVTFSLLALGVHVVLNVAVSSVVYILLLYFLHEPLFWEIKKIAVPDEVGPSPQSA